MYRVEKYLDQCIKSITGQTCSDLEIILVDDGSPDGCPAICDKWKEKDPRIQVIHKENGGLSDARNAGLAKARGDYIGFVDSDDWIGNTMYEKLRQALKRDGSGIACCAVMKIFEDGREELLTHSENCILETEEAERELIREGKLLNPVWYKLYKRSVLEDLRFETGKQHEDMFFTYRAVANAEKISILTDIGYYYRQRADSIMGRSYGPARLDGIEALEKRLCFFKRAMPELESQALINLWQSCIYSGQMILKYMKRGERQAELTTLKNILDRNPLFFEQNDDIPFKSKVWLFLAKYSFLTACRLRNLLGVGF